MNKKQIASKFIWCAIIAHSLNHGFAVAQDVSEPFKRLDRNKDGQLTKDEFSGRLFDQIDTNKDGVISAKEDQAFSKRTARRNQSTRLPESINAKLDIPYAGTDNPRQRIDLYLPKKRSSDRPLPVVVFVHGGGWRAGDKRGGWRTVAPLVESGDFIGASVGYRLTDEAIWPAQIHDCKAAIRWLKANAQKYNLDPEKIGVTGTSAGGHLVAMLGTSGDVPELEGKLGDHLKESSRVHCVVDQFGPTDLLAMGGFHNNADSPESKLIGGAIQENKEATRKASPTSYVSKDDPPCLFIHGTKDPLVPFSQSELLHAAFRKAGVDSVLVAVEGGKHGNFGGNEVAKRLRQFFDKHLRGQEISISNQPIKLVADQAKPESSKLFDMAAIRDPSTLEVQVLQDWHVVEGVIATRQKLVTINVGEMWPGQNYRVPVRMVVPANRKAKGFHLTGGSTPTRLKRDTKPNPLERELLSGGVGLVTTVVQEPGSYGEREMAKASEQRFAETLNPRFKIQYWAWPAVLMRAITTAYAQTDHFEAGKVAASGGSKNGASPSMAILHDQRMTAVHATVSPIWDSPLRLCDRAAWDELESQPGRRGGFSGGHYGPSFNRAALAAGHTWSDLQKFTRDISEDVFISRNLKQLRRRGVEMLFHPGTHDMVAFDIAWGGSHHPDIPIYLGANTGHGKKGHPGLERDQQNKAAFLLRHFFPDQVSGELLSTPTVEYELVDDKTVIEVVVRFPAGSGEESGRIWWMFDRAPDGSPEYLSKLIPDDNFVKMHHDHRRGVWVAEIELDQQANRIDFFCNHGKTIRHKAKEYRTYLSSPCTRVELRK